MAGRVSEAYGPTVRDSHQPLSARTAIVTGGSSGLGSALALGLWAAGANVVVTARRLDRAQDLAEGRDGILALRSDIADEDDRQKLLIDVRREFGPVDVVVNNAGSALAGIPFHREPLDRIEAMIATNLVGPIRLLQLAFSDLRERAGAVINIGSIAGQSAIGRIPQASYAATKGGLHALTRELAAQWARFGIRVNAIAPGFFHSELTDDMYASHPDLVEWVTERQPLQRQSWPEDYVGAAVFLASDASRHVTGQIINVDGGWSAL